MASKADAERTFKAKTDAERTFKWETLKGMPTKRVFSTPVEARGLLYVVGGCDQMGTPIDAFEVIST